MYCDNLTPAQKRGIIQLNKNIKVDGQIFSIVYHRRRTGRFHVLLKYFGLKIYQK